MQFQNIIQAINYAQQTGDTKTLEAYSNQRVAEAANRIMSAVTARPLRGDDIYFLLAFGSALLDVHSASLSDNERELIQAIKKGIQVQVVKTTLPFIPRPDLSQDEDND